MRKNPRYWRYKNTLLLLCSLGALALFADTDVAHALVREFGNHGYLGAAVAGLFFVSTFTFAPASVVLYHLAQDFNPYLIALSAGAGGVVGDIIIFRFIKDGVFDEIRPFLKKFKGSHFVALARTPYFVWLAPVAGALIIASPFPDEIGIGLMGLSRISTWQFAGLAFVLNAVGILGIVLLARSF